MTETELDKQLAEVFSEEVPCEGSAIEEPHAADIYASFTCEHCDTGPLLGAECYTCHDTLVAIMNRLDSLPCLNCSGRSSLAAYRVLGTIR